MVNFNLSPFLLARLRAIRSSLFLRRYSEVETSITLGLWVLLGGLIVVTYPRVAATPAMVYFAALHGLSAVLSVRMAQGVYTGFSTVIAAAAMFTLGPVAGLIALAPTVLLVGLVRIIAQPMMGIPLDYRTTTFIETIRAGGIDLTAMLVGGSIAAWLEVDLSMGFVTTGKAIGTFTSLIAFMLVKEGLTLGSLLLHTEASAREYLAQHQTLLRNLLWVLFAPAIALMYLTRPDQQAILFVLTMAGALQVYATNRSALRLRYRVDDLREINQLGQNLADAQTVDEVLDHIDRTLSRFMDAGSLLIALYDQQEDHISIARDRQNGVRANQRSAPGGMVRHIIDKRETLVLPACNRRVLLKRGIESTPPTPASCLAVPMMAGDEIVGVIALRNYHLINVFTQEEAHLVEAVATQAANAIRGARLKAHSNRQSSELRSLNVIASTLSTSLDLGEIIDSVCQVLTEVVGASKAAVFLLNDSGGSIEARGSAGLSDVFRQSYTLQSARARALRDNEILIVQDIFHDTRFRSLVRAAEEEGFRAVVDVPIRTGERAIGTVAAYFEQARAFTQAEIELITTLANQMAMAVSNAYLFEATRSRQQDLEQLYEFTSALSATLSIEGVCHTVVNALIDMLEADSAVILTTEETNRTLAPMAARVGEDALTYRPRGQETRAVSTSEVEQRFTEGDTLLLTTNEMTTGDPLRPLLADLGAERALCILIRAHRDVIGLAVVGVTEDRAFAAGGIRMAESLAVQASVALQNARLFEYTDVMLAIRLEEIAALEEIVRRMARRLDLLDIIEQVALAAAAATGAEYTEVALLDESSTTFETLVEHVNGEIKVNNQAFSIPPTAGIVGRALEARETLVITDVENDSDYLELYPGVKSELAAPILLDTHTYGVINVESTRRDAFSGEQAHFITNLAEHAAIAIHNVRLFDKLQRGREEFASLRAVAIKLLNASNIHDVMHTIAQAAMDHIHPYSVHIYLYDEQDDQLSFGTSLWDSGEVDLEAAPPRDDGLTIRVARSGSTITIRDTAAHPLFMTYQMRLDRPLAGAIVAIPLKYRGQVHAVFTVGFKQQDDMDDETLRYLDLLTAQASVAIHNARLDERLREQFNQLEAIVGSITDGIMMLDNRGKIQMTNSRLDYLLDVLGEDFHGRPYTDLFEQVLHVESDEKDPLPTQSTAEIDAEITGNPHAITRRQYRLFHPKRRAIEEISLPVTDKTDQIIGRLFTVRDVTQQHELDEYRQDMTSMLVHDLRGPLSGVISGLYLAADETEAPTSDRSKEIISQTLQVSLNSANHLLDLVESILDVNKLEAGEMELSLAPLNLGTIAELVRDTLDTSAMKADVRIKVDAPESLAPIHGDRSLLERVVINLVDNAIRFSPEGGTVTLSVVPSDVYQTFIVADEGSGIPEEHRERIFERFYQIKNQYRRPGRKGSGLGLNFAQLAIEAHGGRIWVEEAESGGAAFHFIIPTRLN